jgi:hypothetical protein
LSVRPLCGQIREAIGECRKTLSKRALGTPVSAARPLSRRKLTVVALDDYGGNHSRLEIGYHGIAAPKHVLTPIAGRSLADHITAM